MVHKELLDFLDSFLKSLDFQKKGSSWLKETPELMKMVQLQKSNFGRNYYINYGYIIKSIPLNGLVNHIGRRLASNQKDENKRIDELLDLETNIPEDQRKNEIKDFIRRFIIKDFDRINSEDELEDYARNSNLKTIPLIVKKHFSIT